MRKFLLLLFGFLLVQSSIIFAQENWQDDENVEYTEETEEPTGIKKAINLDVGFGGPAGVSAALGFRYWFGSFTFGLGGFANSMPNYSRNTYNVKIYPNNPLPAGYSEEKYGALVVTGDFGLHYDGFKPFSVFVLVGFYSQTDSVLAYDYKQDVRYFYHTLTSSGLAFGFGGEYKLQDAIYVGLGYHTKRGVFAKLTYYWY